MIGILDYGMGNLGSVCNAMDALQVPARILNHPEEMDGVQGLLMPGQGAFRDCMAHLREQGWVDPVKTWISADRPFFGICMGLQVLFEGSEESPGVDGLGVLPGQVRRFPGGEGLKVPQMGWNRAQWVGERGENPVFPAGLHDHHFYFVHSFYVPRVEAPWVAATSTFGLDYVSAVSFGQCHAVQFHPEKSQSDGLALLQAFAATCC
jgi:imidazole glycerol phosphate synthase glutamine amidotransferase subunit